MAENLDMRLVASSYEEKIMFCRPTTCLETCSLLHNVFQSSGLEDFLMAAIFEFPIIQRL